MRGYTAPENPFAVTKASDLSDSEINDTWVDWPAPGGFIARLSMRSPMARIITGGKGAGRTHLMRHYSASAQVIRGVENPIEQIRQDGVLGIYTACSALNSHRFRGRGQTTERWQSISEHYVDIWLAQVALAAFETATKSLPPTEEEAAAIVEEVRSYFYHAEFNPGMSLVDLRNDLHHMQRQIDIAVSLAAVRPGSSLDLPTPPIPGSLVFGIPAALRHHYQALADVTYLYLIDEFENLDDYHERYINALLRERTHGVSFMVGVRTFGFQTPYTLQPEEPNRRGAEIEQINLDRGYTQDHQNRIYRDFCREVVALRLANSDLSGGVLTENLAKRLGGFFETTTPEEEEQFLLDRYEVKERPYLQRLAEELSTLPLRPQALPLHPEDVSDIVDAVRVPSSPLLEKANVLLIYRAWRNGKSLTAEAERIVRNRCPENSNGTVRRNQDQQRILGHYAGDLRAQLRGKELYTGSTRSSTCLVARLEISLLS